MTTATIARRLGDCGLGRTARAIAAATAITACAAPALTHASDTTTTVDVTVECDRATYRAGTLPDGSRLGCVAQSRQWTCRIGDGQALDADTTELDRFLSSGDGAEANAAVLPKFKVKISINVRPKGG